MTKLRAGMVGGRRPVALGCPEGFGSGWPGLLLGGVCHRGVRLSENGLGMGFGLGGGLVGSCRPVFWDGPWPFGLGGGGDVDMCAVSRGVGGGGGGPSGLLLEISLLRSA